MQGSPLGLYYGQLPARQRFRRMAILKIFNGTFFIDNFKEETMLKKILVILACGLPILCTGVAGDRSA
jgi:hypothetical protein